MSYNEQSYNDYYTGYNLGNTNTLSDIGDFYSFNNQPSVLTLSDSAAKGKSSGDKYADKGDKYGDKYADKGDKYGDKYADKGDKYGDKYADKGDKYGDKYADKGDKYGDKYADKGDKYGDKYADKHDKYGKSDKGSKECYLGGGKYKENCPEQPPVIREEGCKIIVCQPGKPDVVTIKNTPECKPQTPPPPPACQTAGTCTPTPPPPPPTCQTGTCTPTTPTTPPTSVSEPMAFIVLGATVLMFGLYKKIMS